MTSDRNKFSLKSKANNESYLAIDFNAEALEHRVKSGLWMTTNHQDVVCHFMKTSVHNLVIHAETKASMKKILTYLF